MSRRSTPRAGVIDRMLALYGHLFSSYTWKALIPLYANGTEFEFREIGPNGSEEANAFVHAAHPAGKFPILRDGETTVIEATAIIEYLAIRHPGSAPLIPSDPGQAAQARMIDRVFDNYVMHNATEVVICHIVSPDAPDQDAIVAAKERLVRAYRWLEDWLGANDFGPHVSLLSCAAAPSLFYGDWIEQIPEDCPRLRDLRAELLVLEAVRLCIDAARPYRELFPPGAPDRD